mmetsp:Transcript_22005/g.65156  ORF Transcript_22005/g.65156 Transcript_22005/m.65156 type:complete len:125 (-) Transcript_22005:134-508(-)
MCSRSRKKKKTMQQKLGAWASKKHGTNAHYPRGIDEHILTHTPLLLSSSSRRVHSFSFIFVSTDPHLGCISDSRSGGSVMREQTSLRNQGKRWERKVENCTVQAHAAEEGLRRRIRAESGGKEG